MASNDVRNLLIEFEIPLKYKVSFLNNEISNLSVNRTTDASLIDLFHHLKDCFNISLVQSLSLLPIAICESSSCSNNVIRLPLVSEHIWSHLLTDYPHDIIIVTINSRPAIDISIPSWIPSIQKQIKLLDVSQYLPKILQHKHIVALGVKILYHDYHIKPELRRGLWMHLLGVFHPGLETLEQRESYIQNLRRIYDTLKWKLEDETTWSVQVRHLRESIQRDAIRTDPSEEFLANPGNMKKLIDIVTIYTLQHSEIKYTQGMTDMLSPILYVMEREDDAYICFAAMFERIKVNFTEWCEGTLNKLERLKHLCEVLDPELYMHLSQQSTEDPFILFFGMVLIECRREFNFNDTLHLMEVLWSAALQRDSPTLQEISQAKWASFMTTVSMEIVYQAFGEIEAPYSTHPLEESNDIITSPRSGSSIGSTRSCPRPIPQISTNIVQSNEHKSISDSCLTNNNMASSVAIIRSSSLPDNGFIVVSDCNTSEMNSDTGMHTSGKELEENSVSELVNNTKTKGVTEMADMSSVSSSNNGQCNNIDTPHRDDNDVFLHGVLEIDKNNIEEEIFDKQQRANTLPRHYKTEEMNNNNNNTLPRSRGSLPPAAFLHNISRPSLSSPYVSSIRALDPPINYTNNNNTTNDPFEHGSQSPSPCSSPLRLSPFSTSPSCTSRNSSYLPSPLPPFLQTLDNDSIEVSMEASHALSELLSGEQSHPNVNRETSLQIKMAEAFSLFICLAILVQNRQKIILNRLDFVSLSCLLNAQTESQSLSRILKLARQLHKAYYCYQMTCFGKTNDDTMFETWLDNHTPLSTTITTT